MVIDLSPGTFSLGVPPFPVFQFSSRFLLNLVSGVSIFVDAWIKQCMDCLSIFVDAWMHGVSIFVNGWIEHFRKWMDLTVSEFGKWMHGVSIFVDAWIVLSQLCWIYVNAVGLKMYHADMVCVCCLCSL